MMYSLILCILFCVGVSLLLVYWLLDEKERETAFIFSRTWMLIITFVVVVTGGMGLLFTVVTKMKEDPTKIKYEQVKEPLYKRIN